MADTVSCRLFVRQLQVEAEIGARSDERGRQQLLIVDVEAQIAPALFDELEATVDYRAIAATARRIAEQGHIVLIETYAQRLALACLALSGISAVHVMVCKPQALAPAMAGVRVTAGVHSR